MDAILRFVPGNGPVTPDIQCRRYPVALRVMWVHGLGSGLSIQGWEGGRSGLSISSEVSKCSGVPVSGFGLRDSDLIFFVSLISRFGCRVSGFAPAFGFRFYIISLRISGFGFQESVFGFRLSGLRLSDSRFRFSDLSFWMSGLGWYDEVVEGGADVHEKEHENGRLRHPR